MDFATMFFDDRLTDAETDSHALRFCRKEWLEDVAILAGLQARASIGHFDGHKVALHPRAQINETAARIDLQHRIARIGQKVDDHLLKLDSIAADRKSTRLNFS